MRLLLSLLISLVLGVSVHGASGSDTPPTKITSSNSTVTVVFDQQGHTYDLSVATSGGATNGIQQLNGFGTNTTFNGATVHNGAHVDTNFVGYGVFTNGWRIGNGWFLPGMAVSNNVGTIFQAGTFQPLADPTAPTTNVISGAGSLNGVYQYAWTFYGGGGDTLPSPVSTITPANNSVLVTVPGPGRGENGRRLWRTAAGGAQLKLLYDFGFGDNGRAWHKTQFLDNVADGALGIDAPTSNTSSLEEFTTTKSVKFFATDYSAAQSGDLTLLTQKQDDPNSLALDVYGQTVIRNILGQPLATYKTGNSGNQLALSHQSTLAGSPINAVFLVRPGGSLEMWPDGTDTNVHAIYINNYGVHIANGGGIIVSGTSTLDVPVTIGAPTTYGDATLTVNMLPNAGLGRHAAIRATSSDPGNNSLFWGHLNTNYLGSLGHHSGSGDLDINFYSYESTNANNQAYAGTVNAPSQIRAMAGNGNLQFNMAPAGASDADISWTQVMKLLHSGGVVIGTNISDPGTMNLHVDGGITTGTNVTVGGNFVVSGTSSLTGKVEVASPSLTDATVSIGATNFTGLNAPLRVTGNGNNILIGHGNTDYLSSIGANFGGGSLEIAAYGYQTNSAIAYSSAINRPTVIRFNGNGTGLPGSISFLNAPLGTTGNAATLTQNVYIAPSGGLSVGSSTIDVANGSMLVAGNVDAGTLRSPSLAVNSAFITNQITTSYGVVTTSGFDVTGGVRADRVAITNSMNMANVAASKVAVFDSLKNLTNAVLTTGTIPVASTTGLSDSPGYVTAGTNVSVIGGLSADTVDATNGIKSAGTSYIGFGSGAINLTGRLAVTHATNLADLASTTAIAVSLIGTNVSAIGGLSAPIVTATNQLHIPFATANKVLIANAQNDATNAVLTTGTIPVASTSGISDGPMQVGAVTNVAFNGGITSDNVHATNGVTSGGFVLKNVSLTQGVSPLVDSTNQTLDFSQGMYQMWVLTNDVCLNAFSGSPSAATIKFRPNGANRNILIDTNWMPVNVQGGTANGSYWQFTVTNGTTYGILSAWATGSNATNVAAVFSQF